MTTYDYYDRPLHRWWERVSFRIAAWADHHPVPFLRGTDGFTWRQRKRGAAHYLRIVSSTPEDRAASRLWLEQRVREQAAASCSHPPA